jgi:hypothetical protein
MKRDSEDRRKYFYAKEIEIVVLEMRLAIKSACVCVCVCQLIGDQESVTNRQFIHIHAQSPLALLSSTQSLY